MAKYKAYPEYKDSGVDFLGLVPNEWSIKSLKNIVMIFNGSTPKSGVEEYWDGDVNWITPTDLSQKSGVYLTDSQRKITKKGLDSCGTSLVPENTVILSTRAPIGSLAITGTQSCTNQGCKSLVAKYKENSLFLYYYLSISTSPLKNLGRGSTFLELSTEDLASFKVPMPNVGIGTIVSFLEHETAKIDNLIEKQQQLIELLKEKRLAVISHAVTKGLNPDVSMKDSGVEWLGEVPEHWDIISISKLSRKITNGYVGPTRDILVDQGIPYIQATHIKKGVINFDGSYFVNRSWSEAHEKSILSKGDVLIVQTGAGTGDIGLVSDQESGFNCHALIIVQPNCNLISGHFLSIVLQASYGQSTLYSIRTGGMHPHLNCGEVQFVKIPVPPRTEQDLISDFITSKLDIFEKLIDKQINAIALLQERRTALISAAVTGKIDVRDWVAPGTQNFEELQEATA
ncbi:restriction endonuclease subunit S [Klebsiella pneumoniae]|jgi:type I restriction enzyme S subunit|uniref:restriction endonuclease subunit S n=1 Tax=Klebsiella quasipneumoniae TaxID=1463165 RepID=UPI0009B97EC3|nr:restriction endonuclease subunit S [Klebsiella quasipneumoniae]MDW8794565.1 restriction endonuclease subunit S [Klebsiella pneumoniae]HCB1425665.1 restriction endonuclease subunit S [Klebsiella quasipneumoniae subsp. similipneumoniae]SLQ65518.1 putative restriction endonuclease S subunit [Klebsiella quasipneumoniae]HDH1684364.1 restriction endonuclease subunit S [Klebsiella quasipneumoniae subsp. similipneumoniae]HDT0307286.1 restriction endonuclease subunit S [Klebsiella quasipneumoniae su